MARPDNRSASKSPKYLQAQAPAPGVQSSPLHQTDMICRNCLRRASRSPFTRSFTSTPLSRSATPNTANPRPADHPAATSTGIAQPFSNPLTPKASGTPPKSKAKAVLPTSIAPAGQPLKGLNYFKGRDDPVALPEAEYPEWLWRCLDVKKESGDGEEGLGDEYSKSKKQRRMAAKRKAKLEARLLASGDIDSLTPKVPLQKQSIDLASNEDGSVEGGLEAVAEREALRKAMRAERRAGIKEKNYLKSV
ncbi:hypothetical protein BP5796_11889 [Coleophoma crateriformis]|uniref:Large ribosomal subunit protein mL54 n=1 Tax=Coleophoma crateriformis TaxID=565419 RepID=A0A3D8QEP6_9HELO|nr:hypothetical protein BP5796_11889 [Coleophoma crateriformis]